MTNNNDIQAALHALNRVEIFIKAQNHDFLSSNNPFTDLDVAKRALAQQQPDAELLGALKAVLLEWSEDNKNDGFEEHFEMYCSVKFARAVIARAEQKGGV